MPVMQEDFEGCCTASILVNFGDSDTAQYHNYPAKYHRLREEVIEAINDVKDGYGIVCAILTSTQETGRKVLEDLGFTGTGEAEKNKHSENTINLYYLHCKDWKPPVATPNAPAMPPRDAQGRFVNPAAPVVQPFARNVPQAVVELRWKAKHPNTNQYVTEVYRNDMVEAAMNHEPCVFTGEEKARLNNSRARKGYKALVWVQV